MCLRQRLRYALGFYAFYFLLNGILSENIQEQISKTSDNPSEGRALFSPRIDYNQWMPVGHSDPLKNDPTFDYVPPTSGNVRYWSEHNDKDNNENVKKNSNGTSEILLLGAPVEHTLHLQSNDLPTQPEVKSANRRSSTTYYQPEPSRVLTPPPLQVMDHTSDYKKSSYWNHDTPASHSSDAFPEESASYVTVIRPKINPNPYSSTVYNKNVRDPIYNLAANVNSLEPSDKKTHWIQSLLQKEITYQPQATTPQIIVAYSPPIFALHTPKVESQTQPTPKEISHIGNSIVADASTQVPLAVATESIFSHLERPTRGSIHLIIQGHSKVKTYGADNNNNANSKIVKHDAKMVPIVPVDTVVKHVVETESKGGEIQVRHLHKLQSHDVKTKVPIKKVSPIDSLLSLLNSSLGGFAVNDKINETKKTNEESDHQQRASIIGPTTIKPN